MSLTIRRAGAAAQVLVGALLLTGWGCEGDAGGGAADAAQDGYPDPWADAAADAAAPDLAPDVEPVEVGDDSEADGSDDVEPSDAGTSRLGFRPLWGADDEGVPSFSECMQASPLAWDGPHGVELIAVVGDVVVGIDPLNGSLLWSVDLPAAEGRRALAAATPALQGDLLVVAYQLLTSSAEGNALTIEGAGLAPADARDGHRAVVIDVAARSLAEAFEPLELRATVAGNDGEVSFSAATQFSRSTLVWGQAAEGLGRVYVTFGNVRDIQPWHGWVFELDMDAWQRDVAEAIGAVFVTTPEPSCGTTGSSGSRQRICGGGLWAPSGPLLVQGEGEWELVLAPGNGQLDLERRDFANSLLRIAPGLEFDAGCDPELCGDFDPDAPDAACLASCDRLFVPRPLPDEADPAPASGACEGLRFFACWQQLDYIGGSTPALVTLGGQRLLAYPTKDGHLYLVDFETLGVMHDRMQLVDYCGTAEEPCRWDWAGMIVTQPEVIEVDGEVRLIVPTFMPDSTHPAGVVTLAVVQTADGPRLERRWTAPDFATAEAVERFRAQSTRVAPLRRGAAQYVVVGEPSISGGGARIELLDVRDGGVAAATELASPGYRFTRPLVLDQRTYWPSCDSDRGRSRIEGIELIEVTE